MGNRAAGIFPAEAANISATIHTDDIHIFYAEVDHQAISIDLSENPEVITAANYTGINRQVSQNMSPSVKTAGKRYGRLVIDYR